MTEFNIEVDASKFYDWAERSVANVKAMKKVLLESAQLIGLNTYPLVPFLTGELQSSFRESVNVTYPFFEVEFGYMVVGADWDYALIQHRENFVHPRQGVQFYLSEGIKRSSKDVFTTIETDYLTALGV